MKKQSKDFLKKLLNASSPSGFEYSAGKIFREYLKIFCDRTYADVMGNSFGVINENAPFKVMLAGHYDEIGFQVVHICDNGFIYFRSVGGIDKITIPGTEVEILTEKGKIPGVIGKKPIHLVEAKDREKSMDLKDLWIDIGTETKKESEKMISIGDPIAFKPNYCELKNNRITSKGLDDKIGAFIAAETIRTLAEAKFKNIAVYCVGTVQEEVGCRGAFPASFSIHPNVGFAIDVGFATDTPDINVKQFGVAKLGKGPILNRNADNNSILGKLLRETSKKTKTPYQEDAGFRASGGTDTAAIQLIKSGVATALISIPNRYMHTQVEMVDLKDVENAIQLLSHTIMAINTKESFIPV
ncbi:MAG: hypothetical protein A2X47_01695 [Lentisphaerae bacterium GWF2_38_69]|nr:MAG: hypothetical protein A2X47_01695 [Lentisphaerae bacterium GWF2_38_69]